MIEETEKAANLILKAVVASKLLYETDKKAMEINPVDLMSRGIGSALADLIADEDEQCQANVDWGARMFDYMFLLRELMILIGRPGILDKLPEHYRETASLRISKLGRFFEQINDERFSNEWLTWLMLTDYDQTQEVIDRKERYYDFEKRTTGLGNFFSSHEVDQYRKMENVYPKVEQELL